MSLGRLMVLAAGVAALALGVGGCRSRARLTAEAQAEVTSVSLDRDTRTTGTKNRRKRRTETETDVSYRYSVNGRAFSGTSAKEGDQTSTYKTGMRAKVCYDPAKPEESEVFTPEHACGR